MWLSKMNEWNTSFCLVLVTHFCIKLSETQLDWAENIKMWLKTQNRLFFFPSAGHICLAHMKISLPLSIHWSNLPNQILQICLLSTFSVYWQVTDYCLLASWQFLYNSFTCLLFQKMILNMLTSFLYFSIAY